MIWLTSTSIHVNVEKFNYYYSVFVERLSTTINKFTLKKFIKFIRQIIQRIIINQFCFVTTKSIVDKQIQHNRNVSSSLNYSKNWRFIKTILYRIIIQFEKNVIAYKFFFSILNRKKNNSNNSFFFESFVLKTNRFRFVFFDLLHQNESKIKKTTITNIVLFEIYRQYISWHFNITNQFRFNEKHWIKQ